MNPDIITISLVVPLALLSATVVALGYSRDNKKMIALGVAAPLMIVVIVSCIFIYLGWI